jgi:hypothetical protein
MDGMSLIIMAAVCAACAVVVLPLAGMLLNGLLGGNGTDMGEGFDPMATPGQP